MKSPDEQLLDRFVTAFQRGLQAEIAAQKHPTTGSSETPPPALTRGEDLGAHRYRFELPEGGARLAPGTACSLRTARGDIRAQIERRDDRQIVITAQGPIDLDQPIHLLVAPWFLHERLAQSLTDLDVDRHAVTLALTLCGKRPHTRRPTPLQTEPSALNPSQRAAVQLASDSDLAFLWGPPGTGKTATLTHVIEELRAQGKRILLASTTNAAIDQVLAVLAERPWFRGAVEAAEVIRLGRSDEETYGTEIADAVDRRETAHRRTIERLRARLTDVDHQLDQARSLLADLRQAAAPQQSLFAEPARLNLAALASLLPPGVAEAVARKPPPEQTAAIERRTTRLTRYATLARKRIAQESAALRDSETRAVREARLLLCTLANAYLSPLMKDQRFDVLIAEEAGMAPLPALFYAACLCQEKAIVVGDPRQLPPIVQSREDIAQRVLGRSIFDVTIPDPATHDAVALLDIQYRMHPAIGDLVGHLFYEGRLTHRADPTRSESIAARAPYPGSPLILVDTKATTTCQRSDRGASRVNPASAELTAQLAQEAATQSRDSIAIITPYAAQAQDIRRRLAARRLTDAVECSTIHRFQGRECDLVILDLVDAAPMRPGLLLAGGRTHSEAAHLLNVSISRARGKLIIVADVDYFEKHAPTGIVKALLSEAAHRGRHVTRSPAA